MKTKSLPNYGASIGIEVYDIDWNCPEEIRELGKLCSSQCIVAVNQVQNISIKKLYEAMITWGDPGMAILNEAIMSSKIKEKHWNKQKKEFLSHSSSVDREMYGDMYKAVAKVTYKRTEKNRSTGMFENGELHWHSDQCGSDLGQRIIGLFGISDTANSQTQFLCTHDAYESLSSDMKSMVKELILKHKWIDGLMAPGLSENQNLLLRDNMVPLDGLETSLYQETASGLPGMKLSPNTFDGFVGMSLEESNKIMDEINRLVYKEEYIYSQNWVDGQIVFMDQEITLHRRTTNIQHGNDRTMSRIIVFLNKLFNYDRQIKMRYKGNFYDLNNFIKLVDQERKKTYQLNHERLDSLLQKDVPQSSI